jgi:predicted transcriptional regulator
MANQNYAKGVEPRLKKLQKAGISINEIFRRAKISRSNWSRWSSGDTSPTLNTHNRLMAEIERAEAEVARKAKKANGKKPVEIDEI